MPLYCFKTRIRHPFQRIYTELYLSPHDNADLAMRDYVDSVNLGEFVRQPADPDFGDWVTAEVVPWEVWGANSVDGSLYPSYDQAVAAAILVGTNLSSVVPADDPLIDEWPHEWNGDVPAGYHFVRDGNTLEATWFKP
jgi:hypothetical protein